MQTTMLGSAALLRRGMCTNCWAWRRSWKLSGEMAGFAIAFLGSKNFNTY